MVIQHNMSAMNAQRQYGITESRRAKNAEKLSSGYKINRAADDAAGLAISEKMRRQIRGLTQASLNAQDGISLVQVADGALNEMHDIVQRMNELSVKAANGTLTDVDRGYVQSEFEQCNNEISRICNNTTFNEIYIFKPERLVEIDSPDYSNIPFDEAKNVGGTNYSLTKSLDFTKINDSNKKELDGKTFTVTCSQGCGQKFVFSFVDGGGSSSEVVDHFAGDTRPDIKVVIDVNDIHSGSDIVDLIYSKTAELDTEIVTKSGGADPLPTGGTHIGHANGLAKDGASLVFIALSGSPSGRIVANDLEASAKALPLQVGSEAGQIIPLTLYPLTTGMLGTADGDVSTSAGASAAIDKVKGALEQISTIRSYYGAMQNRLEHTIKNLDNVVENTTAAESAIRDTDMATTMVEYSNDNILSQAGVSMMTQANQMNSLVLSLLS